MQNKSLLIKNILFLISGLFLFIFDRFLKNLAENNFFSNNFFGIKNFIFFDYFQNPNISFSLPTGNMAALIISILILFLFLAYYVLKIKNNKYSSFIVNYSLFLIFIGSISNIIDRIRYGYVIDYINVLNINVLNIADILIFFGLFLFIISNFEFNLKNDIKN